MMDKKKQILKLLEKERMATSKIAFILNSNTWHITKYLEELEREGKITKFVVPNATYWSLK